MILFATALLLLKNPIKAQAASSTGNKAIQYAKCGSNYNQTQIETCKVSKFLSSKI